MLRKLACLLALCAASLAAQNPSFDVLISGARVVDGSGATWFRADIGIRGDRIAAVGLLPSADAKLKIDGRGLVAAPGFIDIHTHARRNILNQPEAENYIRQGVTTLIEGQDGSSPIPVAPFLEKVAAKGIAPNFGMLAGHGSIRAEVMGSQNRKATPAEIQKMKALMRQAMADGALGLSTGLFYVPGNYAPTEEVIELARVAAEFGGIHISHMRDEADKVLESIRETIRIGEEGGLPTQVTHHKIIGVKNWGKSAETLKLMEEARRRGVDVTVDQYPYTASSTGTAALFPQWALEGGRKALAERLAARESRARIKQEIVRRIREDRGGGDPANVMLANCPFDASLAGKSLADVTRAKFQRVTLEDAAETAIEIQQRGGCQAVYHAISEQDVERILRSPLTMVASDGEIPEFGKGAPHPRSYGTFARVLARYVREKNVISLEEAVRKMTSFPAARAGLTDRGLLRPGMYADLALFDPARVLDRADFKNPHQYAEGFLHVIVNGQAVLLHGKLTSARPGRVLYGPGYRR